MRNLQRGQTIIEAVVALIQGVWRESQYNSFLLLEVEFQVKASQDNMGQISQVLSVGGVFTLAFPLTGGVIGVAGAIADLTGDAKIDSLEITSKKSTPLIVPTGETREVYGSQRVDRYYTGSGSKHVSCDKMSESDCWLNNIAAGNLMRSAVDAAETSLLAGAEIKN